MSTIIGPAAAPADEGRCAICGDLAARVSVERQDFAYRDGAREVILTAEIPVVHCDGCDITLAAAGAEEIQHAAVCRYLGRLTPVEIRSLRERLGVSQAKLAEMSQIGIASIKRWESGSNIQNASLDARLRALDVEIGAAMQPRAGFRFQFDPRPEAVEASRRFRLRTDTAVYAEAA